MSNIFFLFKESNFENKRKFISLLKLFLFFRYSNFRTLDFMTSSNASEWIKKHILLNNMGRKHSWNISSLCNITKEKKKLYGPFFLDWVQLSQGCRATIVRQFTFYHLDPRSFWYLFYRPGRMEDWVGLGATQWFWNRDTWIWNPI